MKLHNYLFALATVAVTGAMASCDDDFERPPVIIPEATYEANTAIAEFKEAYWQYSTGDAFSQIPVNAEGDSIIIGGYIVSSDTTGNMFKQIVVQDESAAILIGVNASGLNEGRYKMGEEIRVNLTGLYVGNYNGLMQIGMPYDGKIGRIDEDIMNLHAQVNGLPDMEKVEQLVSVLSIPEIASKKDDKATLIKYQSALVRFEDVTFKGGGQLLWSDNPGGQYYTTRQLEGPEGKWIAVNTSNRCTFADNVLPAGTGTVTSILSYFKGDWQLVVCNPRADCVGFTFPEPAPVIFKETFSGSIGEFTIDNVKAPAGFTSIWQFDSKYGCVVATGYDRNNSANYDTDSYLISPVIDLTAEESAYICFDHAVNYFSSLTVAKEQTSLMVREAGTTEWTRLAIPVYGDNAGFTFVNSGDINLKAYCGKKIEVAFRYTSTTAKAGTWEVKNVIVKPTGEETPTQPETPGDKPGDETVFSESFSAGQGAFTIENVVMGDGLTFVWNFDERYACMKASAFINQAYDADSYLISPEIDLAGTTAPVLTFEHAVNKFASVDAAKSQITLNIREAGTKDWTPVNIPDYGTNTSWTFFNAGDISLAAYAGKKIQIAFRYTSTTAGGGTWEVKNVSIKK